MRPFTVACGLVLGLQSVTLVPDMDPDTAESNPDVLREVAKNHKGMAGVYGAVLVEGIVRAGDSIELLD